jgi:hypothetical protein
MSVLLLFLAMGSSTYLISQAVEVQAVGLLGTPQSAAAYLD